MRTLAWRWYHWHELTPDVLYGLLKLRSDIFVVEQNCVFSDMDGIDPQCEHLCATDVSGRVLAGLRLVPPGLRAPQPSIGRVVVDASLRSQGVGAQLMHKALEACAGRYPGQAVFVSAQQHLEAFYGTLGFQRSSEPYLEDDIPHIEMLRPA